MKYDITIEHSARYHICVEAEDYEGAKKEACIRAILWHKETDHDDRNWESFCVTKIEERSE